MQKRAVLYLAFSATMVFFAGAFAEDQVHSILPEGGFRTEINNVGGGLQNSGDLSQPIKIDVQSLGSNDQKFLQTDQSHEIVPSYSFNRIIAKTLDKRFNDILIQQEQEGNLAAQDPRDSSGNVFQYYRPLEMRPYLVEKSLNQAGKFDKAAYALRRLTRVFRAKNPWALWEDMPLNTKLAYISLLADAVTRDRGRDAVWNHKVFLLLERSHGAPDYTAPHPHFERPPAALQNLPHNLFFQPEIVTDKEHPASTIREAINRTKEIIKDTGHAGTQFHIFMRAEPAAFRTAMPAIQSMLQLVNNVLYAKAALNSYDNLFHQSLSVWHQGRSQRIHDLVTEASDKPNTPNDKDPNSEKHANLAFRYWGLENGRMVISFELRGAKLDWKKENNQVRGIDGIAGAPERDYNEIEHYLTFLTLFAAHVLNGTAPDANAARLTLNVNEADRMIHQKAGLSGIPSEEYLNLAAFSSTLLGDSNNISGGLHPTLLLPFAFASDPHFQGSFNSLCDVILEQSIRLRSLIRAGKPISEATIRNIKYILLEGYDKWLQIFLRKNQTQFETLFRDLTKNP